MLYRITASSLLALAAATSAQAAPIADYSVQFNNLFDATAHPELGLVNADVTAAGLQTHGFYNDQGIPSQITLDASSILPSAGDYTINMDFGGVEVTRWEVKLLDFANRTQDIGLYINDHTIAFYDYHGGLNVGSSPLIQDNTPFSVTLSRSSATNLVVAYLNGIQQFSFVDTLGLAVFNPLQPVYLFTDDVATPGSGGDAYESRAGVLKGISVFSSALSATDVASISAVPEPESYALALAGLLTVASLLKRRRG